MADIYRIAADRTGEGRTGFRVPWWSFTKSILAAAAMRLAELGRLDLDAPAPRTQHRLRSLLRHEAGLPDYTDWPDYHRAVAQGRDPYSASDILRRGEDASVQRPAVGAWKYSNIGYLLVARAVAEAAATPLALALTNLVLAPAGAGAARLAEVRADLAGVEGVAAGYHPRWVYHGLVVGDLDDAARVLHALLSGQIVSAASLCQMFDATPLPEHRTPQWPLPAYGLGLMAPRLPNGAQLYGHTGDGPSCGVAVYGTRDGGGWTVVATYAPTSAEAEARAVDTLFG